MISDDELQLKGTFLSYIILTTFIAEQITKFNERMLQNKTTAT
jgi:hypothetical protein